MKPIAFIVCALFCSFLATSQTTSEYSRAKIYLDDAQHSIQQLAQLGLAIDHGNHKQNTYFVSDFSKKEIELARKEGFKVEILIEDVSKFYRDQNNVVSTGAKTTNVTCSSPPVPTPSHFFLGSYQGYFTYSEMFKILDSMHTLYPNLISLKQPIGSFLTAESRPLYWLRVSNNPTVNQTGKPQILYTALHHAREPGSLSQMIFFLWHLLENYSTDPQIKAIVDNAELYFIPCVNPDGYNFNIVASPFGGGMWRKNRRDNLDGEFGVDLNRNYGTFWGYDNVGSSPMTFSDVYRGAGGFSEPETQAVKWFTEQHQFKLSLNYHTFQNTLIYPWGHLQSFFTPDSSAFRAVGDLLTEHNDYKHGTCNEVLWYVTNGGSDDWMYGDVTNKPKILSMTPEIGVDGFYSPSSQITAESAQNLPANIKAAALLLPYASIKSLDEKIITQPSGFLNYSMQKLGLADSTFTVSIIPLDSWLTVTGSPKVYTGLTALQIVNDSVGYTLASQTPNHQLVRYVLRVHNGYYNLDDTISFYYGKYHTITYPSPGSLAGWSNGGWGLSTSDYYSPPNAFQSSLTGFDNYNDNDMVSLSTTVPIDLSASKEAYLYFNAKWFIETNNDFLLVTARPVSTGVGQVLCGDYTRTETTNLSVQGTPHYDGVQRDWVREEMNLHDFLGQKVHLEFSLVSDAFINNKGFLLDDVMVITVQDSTTAITDVRSENFKIYPVPANDKLIVSVPSESGSPIIAVLYDCLGRELKSQSISSTESVLHVAELPAGMYALKLMEAGKPVLMKKISILH